MARPATGWVRWRRNKKTGRVHWHAQLTLKNGERSEWVALDPEIPEHDKLRAKACARLVSDEAREAGVIPDTVTETVAEYAERWCKWRTTRGIERGDETPKLPEDSARSPSAPFEGGSRNESSSGPSAEGPRPSEPAEAKPLTLEVFRRKLDAAIVAEQWDAVKAIRQRMIEVERAEAANVIPLRRRV